MRVGGPRVGGLVARRRGAAASAMAAAHSPKAPSTCTQAPRACASSMHAAERVEGAGVHVAGLQRDRCSRPGRPRPAPRPARRAASGPARRRRPRSARRGRGSAARGRRCRAARRRPARVTRGPPSQAVAGRRPSRPRRSTCVAAGGQAGEVGHRPAGDEADVGRRGQAEQVEQPGGGDLLDRRPSPGVA